MKLAVLVALAFALMVSARPAAAQIASDRSGSSTTSVTNSEKVFLENLWMYGSCFATSRPTDTKAFLATAPASAGEAAVYARINGMKLTCVGEELYMTVPARMLRGALAEGAYRHMVKRNAPPVIPAQAPGPLATTLAGAARCYVAGHAAQAHALIFGTKPGSSKEEKEINAVLPDFFRCLSSHVPVDMPAVELRYALAEALYHAAETQGAK